VLSKVTLDILEGAMRGYGFALILLTFLVMGGVVVQTTTAHACEGPNCPKEQPK